MVSLLQVIYFFLLIIATHGLPGIREKRQRRYVTVEDMSRSLHKLDSKLSRHEYREAQLGDFTKKNLNVLVTRQTNNKNKLQNLSKQLAKMEERMISIESLIATTDERQRHMIRSLSEGVNRLIKMSNINAPPLPELPPRPGSQEDIQILLNKMKASDSDMMNNLNGVQEQMKKIGHNLNQRMTHLQATQDNIIINLDSCTNNKASSLTEVVKSLKMSSEIFAKEADELKNVVANSGSNGGCSSVGKEILTKLEHLEGIQQNQTRIITIKEAENKQVLLAQNQDIHELIESSRLERESSHSSFNQVLDNIQEFNTASQSQLTNLEKTLRDTMVENTNKIKNGITNVGATIKLKSSNIMDAMDDTVSQNNNLQEIIRGSFDDLEDEIAGLKKVEQVMISTADAVLDTKRSIEFGIKQVIIELSDIVKNSGKEINSTLSDKINEILFKILINQSNMTQKMENEISQVWRQIGVMYQQVTQSVNILDDLQSSTSQQMNASLNRVDNMDGTMDKINNKVAGVEDDLNFLLGRLSLVVSEFSQLKSGVGTELDRLRQISKEFSDPNLIEYKLESDKPKGN